MRMWTPNPLIWKNVSYYWVCHVNNRILGTVVYIQLLKWQASLWGHDLARKYELVVLGHRFGKVSVLVTMWCNFYLKELEWTSNVDWLKFNSRSAQMYMNLIEGAVVAFVRSLLDNFCKTQKIQTVQTHKTSSQKDSWHTGYNPSVRSNVQPSALASLWEAFNAGNGDVHHVVVNCYRCLHFIFETHSMITWAIIHSSVRYPTKELI